MLGLDRHGPMAVSAVAEVISVPSNVGAEDTMRWKVAGARRSVPARERLAAQRRTKHT